MPELKPNKHGIDFEDRTKKREVERSKLKAKYAGDMEEGFFNLKKHEFVVR